MTRDELGDRELARAAFAQAIVRGLSDTPRRLSCRYPLRRRGRRAVRAITRSQYYLTRTEDALLAAHAVALRAYGGPEHALSAGVG